MDNDFLSLQCPACGARLQLGSAADRFICPYCGSQQILRRSGGAVSAEPIVAALDQMQSGVDRTASEMAITRIKGELSALQVHRSELMSTSIAPPNGMRRYSYVAMLAGLTLLLMFFLYNMGNSYHNWTWVVSLMLLSGLMGVGQIAVALKDYAVQKKRYAALCRSWQQDMDSANAAIQQKEAQLASHMAVVSR